MESLSDKNYNLFDPLVCDRPFLSISFQLQLVFCAIRKYEHEHYLVSIVNVSVLAWWCQHFNALLSLRTASHRCNGCRLLCLVYGLFQWVKVQCHVFEEIVQLQKCRKYKMFSLVIIQLVAFSKSITMGEKLLSLLTYYMNLSSQGPFA